LIRPGSFPELSILIKVALEILSKEHISTTESSIAFGSDDTALRTFGAG
jgi:hypothetical protein